MADHRVRLTDRDLDVITAALRARAAGVGDRTAAEILWLAERLEDLAPGNPKWRFGSASEQP